MIRYEVKGMEAEQRGRGAGITVVATSERPVGLEPTYGITACQFRRLVPYPLGYGRISYRITPYGDNLPLEPLLTTFLARRLLRVPELPEEDR